ncbi:M1-specific T cell receptor alpha chain-like [Anomaloglossus baeobatrachus]|uniref:M1-specific T cell receptor alpha chain-like n=1 Tax=Anomaloglossus baeobatrachus TaxID=238106 RepID=UPI003F50133E
MMWMKRRTILPGLILVSLIIDVQSDSQVSQDPDLLATENQDVTLKCIHKMPNYDILIWYKHIPGLGLEICAYGVATVSDLIPRYSMTMNRATLTTELHLTGVKGEDTAVYYCAGRDTTSGSGWGKLVFGSGTQVHVTPRTKRTIPSVYQLKSDNPAADLPSSVCLVTDFPTPNRTLSVDEKLINLNEKSALDKSSNDVWRYSAVIWDNENPSKDLSCNVKYNGKDVPQEKNIIDETDTTCSSLTISARFRTNPGLNMLSLSVFGLRMLTAKAVIVNLIITLRLWSS